MPVGEQIAILYCGTHALMKDVPVDKVREFQEMFLENMRTLHAKDVLEPLAAGQYNGDITAVLEKEAAAIAAHFKA